jgi:CheY-like chemotaxis protein
MFVVNIPQKIKTLSSSTEESKIQEDVIIDIDNYTNKKILIVDDNALNIKVARRALQDFNFDIEDVSSGQECLDKVNSGIKYDLILMDIMMPNMSGETTFKKLKEINGFNVPVIALTADAVAGAEEHYKGEGFIDYIAKPFKREQIKEKLDLVFDAKTEIDWNKVPVHVIGE